MSINVKLDEARKAIERAAFEPATWDDALAAVAAAAGAHVGQLCAMGSDDLISFNRLTGLPTEFTTAWSESGFDHPAINSRVRIGLQAPVLRSLDERAFLTEQDGVDCPEYGEMIRRFDIPFICLTNLVSAPDAQIGFAILRGSGQGNIEGEDRRIFDHLAGHVQRAVNMSRAIGVREAAAIARGMDAIHAMSFICDTNGRVLGMSRRAEDFLNANNQLALVGHHLFERRSGRNLSRRARAVAMDRSRPLPPLTIPGDDDMLPLIAEFAPVPADTAGFPGAPGTIITLRRPWSGIGQRIETQAMPLYHLTRREAQVAAGLCSGKSPQHLAAKLSLGLGTIRTHIRRLFDKTGAGSLAQLVAILGAYGD